MNNSLVVDGLDIREFSDDELASRLKDFGFPCGPIVDSTRAVYQRKLAKLLRNEDEPEQSNEESEGSGKEEEECAVHSSGIEYTSIGDITSPHRLDHLKRRPLPRAEGRWDATYSSPRGPGLAKERPSSPKPAQSSIPMTYKLIGVAVVLLFFFVIYYNMESSTVNPVPPIFDE